METIQGRNNPHTCCIVLVGPLREITRNCRLVHVLAHSKSFEINEQVQVEHNGRAYRATVSSKPNGGSVEVRYKRGVIPERHVYSRVFKLAGPRPRYGARAELSCSHCNGINHLRVDCQHAPFKAGLNGNTLVES